MSNKLARKNAKKSPQEKNTTIYIALCRTAQFYTVLHNQLGLKLPSPFEDAKLGVAQFFVILLKSCYRPENTSQHYLK